MTHITPDFLRLWLSILYFTEDFGREDSIGDIQHHQSGQHE